jgi:hypothetical protein
MKKLFGIIAVCVLCMSMASAEQFKSLSLNGSVTGLMDNSTDSVSFSGANMLILDASATWDYLVGVVDVSQLAEAGAVGDSINLRDTAIVTLKTSGLGGLRIDTLSVDTLVILRDRGEIKYSFDRYVQTSTTTSYSLDSGGVATDSGWFVNTNTVITSVPRFALNLDHLVLDFHIIDSAMGSNDSATYSARWLFELIDEN